MAWVRIHDGAMTHPKLAGLSDKAFRLWVWGLAHCQQHLTDGRINYDAIPSRLRRAIDTLLTRKLWEADTKTTDVRTLIVHDFLEWNDSREQVRSRQRMAKKRLDDWREKQAAEKNALETPPVKRVANGTKATLLKPNRTKPNLTIKEEEEPRAEPSSPPFVTFPVVGGKTGGTWSCTEQQLTDWAEAYPALDLRGEVRRALAWIQANPTKRKTAGGMLKFLVSWFNRRTNEGGGRREPQAAAAALINGCFHTPPCVSASAHTRRELDELDALEAVKA